MGNSYRYIRVSINLYKTMYQMKPLFCIIDFGFAINLFPLKYTNFLLGLYRAAITDLLC